MYLHEELLDVQFLGRGYDLLDTGTFASFAGATAFVEMIENQQGITISAPEEIAYINGWTSKEQLLKAAERYEKSPYGQHLKKVAEGEIKY